MPGRLGSTVRVSLATAFHRRDTGGQPRVPWYSGVTREHRRVLYATFGGWTFDGYETLALVLVVTPALQDLLGPSQQQAIGFYAGLAIGLTLLGWGVGGLVGGVLAEYIGRRQMMIYAILWYAVFTGVTAASTSFAMLVAFRFLTGLATGAEWATGATLLQETWPDRARAKGAGFMQSGFGFGTLLASLIWLYLSQPGPGAWRYMFVIGIAPAFLILYIRRTIGESQRWRAAVAQRRWSATEQAEDQPDEPVGGAPAAGVQARQEAEGGPVPATGNKRPFTIKEMLAESRSRRRVIVTVVMSLGTIVGWYAVSAFLPQFTAGLATRNGLANPQHWATLAVVFYNVGAILGYLSSGFVADSIGRRGLIGVIFLGSLVMTPITYLWWGGIHAFLAIALINGAFTLGGFAWLPIYPPELFTSTVRSTATSFIFNVTRLVAWVGPIVSGTLIVSLGGVSLAAVYIGSVYLLGLIMLPFLWETKNKPLPA